VTVELFASQPQTTVSSGGTTAPSPGTVENWTVASSGAFPAASSTAVPATQFHVADTNASADSEIIAVTNVSGTTWTVTRGAEGSTPVAHTSGFTVRQVVTKGWLNTVPASGASSITTVYASGDTTGAADTTAIQNALSALPSGGTVYLASYLYYTNTPIIVPPCVTLQGATFTYLWPNEYGTPNGSLAPQSQIIPVSAFSGDSVIKMIDQSTGGYAAASGNQVINNITVNGSSLPGGNTVNGFEWYGSIIGMVMNECSASAVGGHGYAVVSHTGAGIGYGDLDQLAATNCVAYACGGDGFHFLGLSDSIFVGCHSIGNTGNAWYSYLGNHNYFTNCKGEWSAIGWRIDVPSGNHTLARMGFEGCSTDYNNGDGFYFTGNQTGGVVTMTGCIAHADGHTGGTATAGFHVSGTGYPILLTGCAAYTDTTDAGTNPYGPAYGIAAGSTPTMLAVSDTYVQGYTAGINYDQTGTVYTGTNVISVTGGSGTVPTTGVIQPVTGWGNTTLPTPTPPHTYTGSVAIQSVLPGPTIAANAAANGLTYEFDCWGAVTTTVDTQTLQWRAYYGGTAGTVILDTGAQAPSASTALTGAAVRFKGVVQFLSATQASAAAQLDQNYYPETVGQQTTAVTSTTAKQLTIGMTPSGTAVSLTINGGYWRRINL